MPQLNAGEKEGVSVPRVNSYRECFNNIVGTSLFIGPHEKGYLLRSGETVRIPYERSLPPSADASLAATRTSQKDDYT